MKLFCYFQFIFILKSFICKSIDTISCPQSYSTCNLGKEGMINVHMVPHTHDDVGWRKTVDQYYYGSNSNDQHAAVQYILDTVIHELLKDENKRFVYVEIAFFWRWWNQQTENMKQAVIELVDNGRLEFVTGGWCMNDEATTYYTDIIDQQTLGLQFILKEFGDCARPRVAWQLDPFGHSKEQASLFAQFGFDGIFHGRIDYQDDEVRSNDKTREFVWKPSSSLNDTVDLFTGVLWTTLNLDVYGPPLGYCFDTYCYTDPIMDDPELEDYNVDQKVNDFIVYVREKLNAFKTNNLMMTMGSDFQYSNAHMWFKNLDKLIYYVNQRQNETNINIFYSTPSCYLYSLYKANLTWPTKNDDFFPYAHKQDAFWTGYYTSRPTLKEFVRRASNYLQTVRQLAAIANLNSNETIVSLDSLTRAMAVLQHHDAVSGTEKQHVAYDYAKRLALGVEKSRSVISEAYAKLLSFDELYDQQYCALLNISECLPIANSRNFTFIIYNPLAREYSYWVRLPVSYPGYIVTDVGKREIIPSDNFQIYDDNKKIPERNGTTNYEIVFRVDLNALEIRILNAYSSENFQKNNQNNIKSGEFSLANEHIQLNFDAKGKLQSISSLQTSNGSPLNANLQHQFCYYDSFIGISPIPKQQSSGAYVFRPKNQKATCLDLSSYTVSQTSLVQEVHQVYGDWISLTIRLYNNSQHVEFEWQVGPIPVVALDGKEVIIKFITDLQSNKTFYTDSNGREILKRVRNYRPTWNLTQTEPVSGNYYPVTGKIFIRDEISTSNDARQLTLVTDRSQGGSSIDDGSLELMLHRRILVDDTLGVSEPLNELGLDKNGLIAKGKIYLVFNSTQDSPRLHRNLAHKVNMKPLITFFNASSLDLNLNKYQPFIQSLPDNVELLTLMRDFENDKPNTNAILVRFEHFYELNEDIELSKPVKLDIIEIFGTIFNISDIEEVSLGANMNVSEVNNRLQWNYTNKSFKKAISYFGDKVSNGSYVFTLQPMQIRTFRIWYSA